VSGPDAGALADRVERAMAKYVVPGVAIGVLDPAGVSESWGFGVTNVDHPLPIDADTVFEIASITKTMTATVAARLAADGSLDLDAPVRRYLHDFRVADETVSATVTVRDLFTHTAGWFGEYLEPTGNGEEAIARGVAAMAALEQVAPVGVFSYNNVSLTLAGRIIEVVSGRPYRDAVRELLFAPLGMDHSAFDPADVLYERLAAGHTVRDGKAVRVRARLSDSSNGDPVGGVRSTVNDLLRYARFHLGDGTAPDGMPLLPAAALAAMREPRVPMGPLGHIGLSWFIDDRDGTRVAAHGGATVAHMSQLVLVPGRGVAIVILTNGANGARLCAELQEWLLASWLGLPPRARPPRLERQPDLAPYAGRYWAPLSDVELAAEDGALIMRLVWKGSVAERPAPPPLRLEFTGPDTVISGAPSEAPAMGDFLRASDGSVAYFRWGSRARRRLG
jgi:CubicO group peptidase (beta-lactamase class C family)